MEEIQRVLGRLGKRLGKKLLKWIVVKTAPVTLPAVGILFLLWMGYIMIFEMPKQAIADTWDHASDRVSSWFYGTSEAIGEDVFERYQTLADAWREGLTADQELQVEPYIFNWEWLAAVDRVMNDPSFLQTYGETQAKEVLLKPEETFEEVRPRFKWVTKEKVTVQEVAVEVSLQSDPDSPVPEIPPAPSYEIRTVQTLEPVVLLNRADTIYGSYAYTYRQETTTSTISSPGGPLTTTVTMPKLERIETVVDKWKPLREIMKAHGVKKERDQDFLLEYWLSFLSDGEGGGTGLDGWNPVNGLLVWPTIGNTITSTFGPRTHPVTGEVGKMHNGIDIGVSTGTPIFAVRDGSITFAGDMGTAGLAIIVEHDTGLESRYYHLSRIDVKTGQHVQAGAPIAASGNTGRSTGPHLHYEVRVNGSPVNPLLYYGFTESSSLAYRTLDVEAIRLWLEKRNSALADETVLRMIDRAGKDKNVDPYLLIAITGAEQGFVPRSHPDANQMIRNPWNVFGSWKEGRGSTLSTEEAARIAAQTIIKLSRGKPMQADAIEWLSSPDNPNGYYAEDPNWWRNVSSIYRQLLNMK